MLNREDIQQAARYAHVPATTIEKDQLLDIVLDKSLQAELGGGKLYFKGGTAIRKLYIRDYRFSEDIDFTFSGSWQERTLRYYLETLAALVQEETGLRTEHRFRITRTVPGEEALEFRIITGSLLSTEMTERIKFDITHYERVLDPVSRPLFHSGKRMNAYSLEEIVAEKSRAVFQRVRPRDIYDIVSLMNSVNVAKVQELARQKMMFKNIVPSAAALMAAKPMFQSSWNSSLSSLLPVVPPVSDYWNKLLTFFYTAGIL